MCGSAVYHPDINHEAPLLLGGAAGCKIAAPGQGPAIDKHVRRASHGYAAAARPVANPYGGLAVDEDIRGAFDGGLAIVRSVAFAGRGLSAHADVAASFDDDAWCASGQISVLRASRRGDQKQGKCLYGEIKKPFAFHLALSLRAPSNRLHSYARHGRSGAANGQYCEAASGRGDPRPAKALARRPSPPRVHGCTGTALPAPREKRCQGGLCVP